MRNKINLPILSIALVYGVCETWHFGWNWAPKSDAEVICDGIAIVINGAGVL
jgi:hypothetical protein